MTQTDFTDNVVIQGSRDITQLKIQGSGSQEQPLQNWQTLSASDLAKLTSDGRMQVGSFTGAMGTNASLIEVFRDKDDVGKPRRGLQISGELNGTLNNIVSWSVHELNLQGSAGISAKHTALRVQLRNSNSGGPNNSADLRAGDIEIINAGATSGQPVETITALQLSVTNQQGELEEQGYAINAYGLKINISDLGNGINNIYAIHSTIGLAHLEDALELKAPGTVPGTPPAQTVRIYTKTDGQLYAKNSSGIEYLLTSGGTLTSVGLVKDVDATWLQIDNSPLTANGNLQLNLVNNLTANHILATPNGSTGKVVLRALHANDIPGLNASKISSGQLIHERGGLETDVSSYDGYIRISGGTTSNVKCRFDATTAPTVNDDSNDGYSVGSRWIDTTNDREYVLLEATVGAAKWRQTNHNIGLSSDAPWLEVGGTPITANGTLTLNRKTSLSANQVLATPNGSTGVVGLRSLDTADITSGTFNNARINWAVPGSIGNTTPNAASFTTLKATTGGVEIGTSTSGLFGFYVRHVNDGIQPGIALQRKRSTGAVNAGDVLGGFGWNGAYNSTDYGLGAQIAGIANQGFSAGNHSSRIEFSTAGDSSTNLVVRVIIHANGKLEVKGDFAHTGSKWGIFNMTPKTQFNYGSVTLGGSPPYRSAWSTDSATLQQLARIVGQILTDLQDYGVFGGS